MGAPDSRIFRVPGGCGGLHSPARARLARATAPPGDPIMYVPKTQEWSRAKRAPDLGPFLLVSLLHFVLSRSVVFRERERGSRTRSKTTVAIFAHNTGPPKTHAACRDDQGRGLKPTFSRWMSWLRPSPSCRGAQAAGAHVRGADPRPVGWGGLHAHGQAGEAGRDGLHGEGPLTETACR